MAVEVDRTIAALHVRDLRAECRRRGVNPGGDADQLRDRLKEAMAATGEYPSAAQQLQQPQQQYAQQNGDVGGVHGSGYAQAQANRGDGGYNNYSRPGGQQNVGNFITDRPSSRVLAPPGGQSTISFGNYQGPAAAPHRMPSAGRRSGPNGAGQQPGPVLGGPGMPPPPYAPMQDWQRPPMHQAGRPPLPPSGYGHADAGVYAGAPMEHSRGNNNNYARPGGQQNVGNFITDKPSSRVLAPPGGKSTISFGNYQEPVGNANRGPSPRAGRRSASPNQAGAVGYGVMPPQHHAAPLQQPGMLDWQVAQPAHAYGAQMHEMPPKAPSMEYSRGNDNNYARPGGQQNVGNFITDRPSSRVLAPPGGKSQITFG